MSRYILRRMLWIAATLLVVSLLTFGLVFAVGDPAVMLTPTRPGQAPKPELVAFIRQQYGLDQPTLHSIRTLHGQPAAAATWAIPTIFTARWPSCLPRSSQPRPAWPG